MKRVVTNVVSAVIIILIMAICNRLTIVETDYDRYLTVRDGLDTVVVTEYRTERLAITGEILSETTKEYEQFMGMKEFLTAAHHSRTLGFR